MLRQSHFVPPVPMIIATETGLFDRAGVHVTSTDTRGSDAQFEQLAAGEQDLAVTAFDNLFAWNRRGIRLRAIAQTERTTPLALFTQPDISHLEDLTDRTFAVDALDNGFALAARRILADSAVTVRFEEVGGVRERMQALVAGDVDATLLGPPFDTIAQQHGLHRLASINELLPGYPGQVLVTREDILSSRRDELQRYVRVLEQAVELARRLTDEEGIALLAGTGLPDSAATALWNERPRTLRIDVSGLIIVAGVRRDLQLLPEDQGDLSGLFDASFASEPKQAS
ncbi:ABC transporter substrate-binding protein [Microbacterium pumilum]|uniref:SsuA/THI5-like domain-containing protein n=1 Tax=Microbacterium pumilum TaxID=344165 RepID=A0ABP5EE80_9MICO